MSKPRFRYRGLEQLCIPMEAREHYCRFAVYDAITDKLILEFFTNKSLEGKFIYDNNACAYRQTRGTCQFSLAGLSPITVRAKLRDAALTKMRYEEWNGQEANND